MSVTLRLYLIDTLHVHKDDLGNDSGPSDKLQFHLYMYVYQKNDYIKSNSSSYDRYHSGIYSNITSLQEVYLRVKSTE